MNARSITVFPLALLVVGAASAQSEEARLTLSEALDRAREVSAALRALDANVAAGDAELRRARAVRLPEVGLSAGYARLSNVPELSLALPDGSRQTIFPNIPNNWSSRIGFSMPLYAGGGLAALEEAARSEREATAGDRRTGEADLVLEVTTAYWSLAAARQAAAVLAEALAAYEAHLKDARNRMDVGLAASNEVLAVEVERDRAELARIRADNAANLAAAELSHLLDLAPGCRFEPAEELEPPERPAPDVETAVRRALETRPERSALQARLTAAQSRAAAALAERRPRIALAGGWDYARPNRSILPFEEVWNDTWDIGVFMSFTLFDSGVTAAEGELADAAVGGLKWRLEDLDRAIRLEVTSRLLDVRNAEAAIAVAERGLQSAAENLRVSRDRYREGIIPSSELLDAEVALLRAGLDRTDALTRLRLARAMLDRATGM